nr:MAG TPA: tail connector protein [Herelleviridae sp.]
MTEQEKLDLLKAMMGDSTESNIVLSTYLKIAGDKIINKAYPYSTDVTEVPKRYSILQCEIAAYLINKRGAEGQTSHSENGISRSYENADIPASMLSSVTPHVGIIK